MRGRAGLCGIVCRQLIKHNDIISRKTEKGFMRDIFKLLLKLISGGGRKKKKGKVKISSGGLYVVPDIFHIFITIKWQFNQRNEYCILIGVICTRISCIIHGGGDHRWVSRRYRLAAADASGGSRHRLHCHDGDSYVKTRRALRELNVLIKNKKIKIKITIHVLQFGLNLCKRDA